MNTSMVKHQDAVSTWFTLVRRCEEAVTSKLGTIGFKTPKLKVIPVQILYCYLALVLLALSFSPCQLGPSRFAPAHVTKRTDNTE